MLVSLLGCEKNQDSPQIVATTLPVYEFTSILCYGTDLTIGQLVTENISCLHDYSLQVNQMRMIESAEAVVISGAGLEDFLLDVLPKANTVIDASENTHIHQLEHANTEVNGHAHTQDPHIWLSPENARSMASQICYELSLLYPHYKNVFDNNLANLLVRLDALQAYGEETLASLSTRNIITFHDGFGYFADAFHLTILRSIEEESGSEASAAELLELIQLARQYNLQAVFVEANASASAANILAAETGVTIFTLDMIISGESYFDLMYRNIDTIKEALE